MKLEEIFDVAVARGATDIHLASGEAPRLRIGGELAALEGVANVPELLEGVVTPEGRARLAAGLPFERTIAGHGGLAFVALVFRVGDDRTGGDLSRPDRTASRRWRRSRRTRCRSFAGSWRRLAGWPS